ncbi:occludin [Electrophorus electricus]|uniref:Occludin n=1 Tax=Electrophorus electricus TaxID=8005 RepID=A0A4W4GGH2_ELEEL|nr:occludin [Electrophorus electricus]XP_026882740.2 occludin [Electrophorus electricus]XP_026882741.2 occludin [Electrophorus electricus]XP_026882742.2 occludin [Electrophorus electricus]
MLEKQPYDSPPMYSPPSNGFGPPGSFQTPRSDFDGYPPPPGSYFMAEEVPQYFYKWSSPPGIVKIMEGAVVVLCLGIFACVASTLVWDMQYGYGFGTGYGSGYGTGYGSGYGYGSYGSYGGYGGYGGYYNYPTPYSAKTAMIAMAAINFIAALAFFVASFSKTRTVRGRKFFLAVLVCNAILAVLQAIINIVYIVGVNPMAQSSSSMFYNPMLMMCQNLYGNSMTGMGAGFPLYNQYLYHYCYVDPQEAVAMVCGFLVVIALAVAAFFSFKTRSKIWRHGKPNVYWDKPLTQGPEGRDVEDWVNKVEDGQSVREASVMFSEKASPPLNSAHSVTSIPLKSPEDTGGDPYTPPAYSDRVLSRSYEVLSPAGGASSSPSDRTDGIRRPSAHRGKRRRRNPDLDESQYETEYTTGGETTNDLDQDHWMSMYPEITSDTQRQEYKLEFDSDLRRYKQLCAEMDDINDELNKLNRELDTLDEGTAKYQAVAEEFNRLKDLKRMPDYQEQKVQCQRLRHKLFHIKRMVKNYDRAQS